MAAASQLWRLDRLGRRSQPTQRQPGALAMTQSPYDAVLCDIDGVLRHWPPARDLEQAHGLPAGAFAAAAFAPARLQPAITGQVTDEQWRSTVVADLAENYGSAEQAQIAVAA